jgi:hypothetical protein
VTIASFIRHRDARADVWTDVERRLELCAVADLAPGQMEIEWIAVEIGQPDVRAPSHGGRGGPFLVVFAPKHLVGALHCFPLDLTQMFVAAKALRVDFVDVFGA